MCRNGYTQSVSVEMTARVVDDWRLSIVSTGRVTGQLLQLCVA